jgi:hypothetical protein
MLPDNGVANSVPCAVATQSRLLNNTLVATAQQAETLQEQLDQLKQQYEQNSRQFAAKN